MSFLSLLGVEFNKIRRSKILLILSVAVVVLWLPSIFNAEINLRAQAEQGILPEYNLLIQGFLTMSWFIFPASMVVSTVLLNQTERRNKGIIKMLSLPVSTAKLCFAKFTVLLALASIQVLMSVGMYYLSAVIVTQTQGHNFILSPLFVFKEATLILLSAVPMLAFFWFLSVCIHSPVISGGIGLALTLPSVLMINTKIWYIYPMAYPMYVITAEYGELAANLNTPQVDFLPWLLVAACITVICLLLACFIFGKTERR